MQYPPQKRSSHRNWKTCPCEFLEFGTGRTCLRECLLPELERTCQHVITFSYWGPKEAFYEKGLSKKLEDLAMGVLS
jgi:hypothetical protein